MQSDDRAQPEGEAAANQTRWSAMLADLLDGILVCLWPDGPVEAVEKVKALQAELGEGRSQREDFENKLERIIEADESLKKAAQKYLSGQAQAAMAKAGHLLVKARKLLD